MSVNSYAIIYRSDDGDLHLPITEERYRSVRNAQEFFSDVVATEHKFDAVLGNLYEVEKELIDSGLRSTIYNEMNEIQMSEELNTINRRIVNLLSTCRLYLDQTAHHIRNMFGKGSPQEASLEAKKSEIYDHSLAYRAMEALRNYVQHRGYPAHFISYGRTRSQNSTEPTFLHRTCVRISVSELAEDGKFKASVLKELLAKGSKFDLSDFLRGYVEGLGQIHAYLRGQFDLVMEGHREALLQVIDTVLAEEKSRFGSPIKIAILDPTGAELESHYVTNRALDMIKASRARNPTQGDLRRTFVTNEPVV